MKNRRKRTGAKPKWQQIKRGRKRKSIAIAAKHQASLKSNVASVELCVTKQQSARRDSDCCYFAIDIDFIRAWFVVMCMCVPSPPPPPIKNVNHVCASDICRCKWNNANATIESYTHACDGHGHGRVRVHSTQNWISLFFTFAQKTRMLVIHFLVYQLQKCRRWQMYETTSRINLIVDCFILRAYVLWFAFVFGFVLLTILLLLLLAIAMIHQTIAAHSLFPFKWCSKSICRAWNEMFNDDDAIDSTCTFTISEPISFHFNSSITKKGQTFGNTPK